MTENGQIDGAVIASVAIPLRKNDLKLHRNTHTYFTVSQLTQSQSVASLMLHSE